MSACGVDAVLFDLGQVLVEWDPFGPFVGRHERAEVEAFFDEIDFPAFNHLQDAGRSWADARASLGRSHPHRLPMLDVYTDHFAHALPGEVPGASDLVHDLRAVGVRVLGLTNWSAETFHLAPVRAPVVAQLEDVLVSGRLGIAKPDPAVFAVATARFALDPQRTLFVDDSPANVAAGAASGFRAVVFTGTDNLRRHLTGLGLPLPERTHGAVGGHAPSRVDGIPAAPA